MSERRTGSSFPTPPQTKNNQALPFRESVLGAQRHAHSHAQKPGLTPGFQWRGEAFAAALVGCVVPSSCVETYAAAARYTGHWVSSLQGPWKRWEAISVVKYMQEIDAELSWGI